MKQLGWIKLGVVVVALATLAAVLAPSAFGGERKLVATMEQPFEVNGHLFSGGELSVRQVGAYSPTATLHEVRVGRDSVGLLLAEVDPIEPDRSTDTLVFERASQGNLVLVGFTTRGERSREQNSYRFISTKDRWSARASHGANESEPLLAER
jgi:hypothetical protein